MVFEALVVDLLNKFLKQYVENLDTSQLKIGIWGGDVTLNDLKLKTALFDDFNLPIKVKSGKLGKLVMKIPWKNLYSSQVIVNIEELIMVVIPNNELVYDPVKEEKWANDKKQARLKAVEDAKKRENEEDHSNQPDGFIEKLATQIIKNIQVVIRNIHIRYENRSSIPNRPFSIGVTMSNLSAETTTKDPTSSVPRKCNETDNFIYKVVNLEGLSIYWNSMSVLYSELPPDHLIKVLLDSIPNSNFRPEGYSYVFGPMSASAFLRLNPKPELDGSNFTIPKVFVNVHLKEIELAVTHNQFYEAMMFIKDYQRLAVASIYRKYRPRTGVAGHAREWWLFAYNAVVEDIRRRRIEWSWKHIKEHREMCRKYSELFKGKLNTKKLSLNIENEIEKLERKLNVFNIVLLREQVYVEQERLSLQKVESRSSTGWFSSWFGYGNESKTEFSNDKLVKKINSVMSASEKQKLYKAIGYEESAARTNYPTKFVEFQFWFHLDEITMTVYDDYTIDLIRVMTLSVKTVKVEFEKRPSAFAMKMVMIVGNFQVVGNPGPDQKVPELVTSNCKESESLFEILYETKPLDSNCDQRIHVTALPLRIIYHADTINRVRDVFKTGNPEDVNRIVAATSASIPIFERMTALGLQYAIEKRTIFEVKVNILSSYLIIPYGGVYEANKEIIVLMLGSLSVETEENEQKDVSVKKLYLKGTTEQEIFSTVVSASYTNFKIELKGVQILLQLVGEDWVEASTVEGISPLRFLESTNVVVTIKKSLVTDDARIPKIIVEGKLPSLAFTFSEERFVSLAALICSIPTVSERSATIKQSTSASIWSLQSIGAQLESKLVHIQKDLAYVREPDYMQGIDIIGIFEMNELAVNVLKNKDDGSVDKNTKDPKGTKLEEKFLNLRVIKLEIEFTSKTFETVNLLKLGGLEFKQYYKRNVFPFVSTKASGNNCYLFALEYVNLDRRAPDFYTRKGAVLNRLSLNTTPLNVLLNKEALLAQLAFVATIKQRLELVKQNSSQWRDGDAGGGREKGIIHEEYEEAVQVDKKVISRGKRFRKKVAKREIVDLFLEASLNEIDVMVECEGQGLAEFCVKGGKVEISSRKSFISVDFELREIFLLDLNQLTIHKQIVSSLASQTLSSRVTVYNSEYFGTENTVDLSIEAEVGGLRCTFVNVFFSRAFAFLNAFQDQIETVKEGATVAAQKAKENVLKAYENATQICLDVKITAPLVVVPKNCTSLEALVLDWGVLTVKNNITELDYAVESEAVGRPIIDTMKFHLQNFKFSRCQFDEDAVTPLEDKTLIIPLSFEMTIKRNLSTAWFRVIPELEVLARLASIHLHLTHDDLVSITTILRENLNEEDLSADRSFLQKRKEHRSHKNKDTSARQHQVLLHDETLTVKEEVSENLFTRIKFVFFMDSFIFDAIVNDKKDELQNVGLARFVLETISLKGRMFSDWSIHTSILLVSCVLDDMRPGKPGRLTRLMERTPDTMRPNVEIDPNPMHSMVEITYQTKGSDTFFDLRVYKFTLILSMDFLQKLGEFFSLKDNSRNLEPTDISKTSRASERYTRSMTVEESVRPPTFTTNLRLEKPDIIIVENMDSINTDAIIFHTEMVMKYRLAGSRQVISGTLNDMELYSCCFNPVKRPYTLNQVIKPFTISVAGSTPVNEGLHVDICLTEIMISINPSTVELISKCYEALLKSSVLDEGELKPVEYTNLWDMTALSEDDYWFLKAEQGVDALSSIRSSFTELNSERPSQGSEICLLTVPSIVVFIGETSLKHNKPLLLLEMGFLSQCYNWSTKLSIDNSLTLKMHYYNQSLSAWEPLIEPVEVLEEGKHSYAPWELNISIASGAEGDLEALRPPKTSIKLSCTDVLPITLTKTGLDVVKNAADIYTSAVTRGLVNTGAERPPYIVKNETGLVVEILLEQSSLEVCQTSSIRYISVKLDSHSEVELQNKTQAFSLVRSTSLLKVKRGIRLCVKFPTAKQTIYELPLGMNSRRYYPVQLGEHNKDVWGLVSDVSISGDTTTVVLQTIVKVINCFIEPIHIHCLTCGGKEAEFIGTVEGHSSLSLPFHAVYNSNKNLFFSVSGYCLSTQSFVWDNIKNEGNVVVLLQCNSKLPESQDPFFIKAIGEIEQIYYANTNRTSLASSCYTIRLQPTLQIVNSLPVDLIVCSQGNAKEGVLQPGNNMQITNAEPGISAVTFRIAEYLEKEWSCKETIPENPSEFLVWKFVSYNGLSPEFLNLGVHCTYWRNSKTSMFNIYSPYLMVNKTGHLLSYKFDGQSSVFHQPGDFNTPLMFSPPSKKFFSKKAANLKFEHSSWSDKFSIDVAGSGGTIECEDDSSNITYKVSVSISLTSNGLTRIVLFTPFYVFVNEAKYEIECGECSLPDYPWLKIPAGACVPFWPRVRSAGKTIQLRPVGSTVATPPFAYDSTDSCLMKLVHEWGGIFVDIQATHAGTYITLDTYEPGHAPALIINHSKKPIKLHEKGTKFDTILQPLNKIMHSWLSPKGDRKLVVKSCNKHEGTAVHLDQDIEGHFITEKGESVRYVSFLDGIQRILLFTEDKFLSESISYSLKGSNIGTEIICKLQGIGISVVNNATRVEILYLGLISSGIAWEARRHGKKRFTSMKSNESHRIEEAYTAYQGELDTKEGATPEVRVSDKIKVDFEKMEMTHVSHKHKRDLQRTFEPGVWIAYRVMDDQVMLHVKVSRIQVDNQLLDCIFPIVLAPVSPPKTVVFSLGPKPFFELSILKISSTRTGVAQYKYFKILVQEFHVKIDIGFIQQCWAFSAAEELSVEEEAINFRKDLKFTQNPLRSFVEVASLKEEKSFYELLHFSPLKIHLSFSIAGRIDFGSLPPALSVMIQSLGVTLTDVNDVIFRLSYFERKSAFLSHRQLINEVTSHYYGQIVRQGYVLIFGLDVIGNPYGLIVGIGEGVEAFFYEPFHGIIQGPSDFAAGVAIGCKSLFGHTVGSTAGTLGKLTETLGKGLAVLSLDKEYQLQRMEAQHRDENIQASMARGGRGLVMGVFEGVTGIVKKPIEGAKEEGVGGFFKGMGKGMMGLVTRPVSGVVDFASTSLNAVKRATEGKVDNTRMRLPRYFRDDKLVLPYNSHEAEGNMIFYSICKRKYCCTDRYDQHLKLRDNEVVVMTNKRLLLAEMSEVFGIWQEHLAIKWTSMPDRPRCHTKGVAITIPPRSGSQKKDKPEVKVLLISDPGDRQQLCQRMAELYRLAKEEKSWVADEALGGHME